MRYAVFVCMLIGLASCSIAPAHEGQLAQLGIKRIVYLDMDSSVGIDSHHLKSEVAATLISPLAASFMFLANHKLDKSGEASLSQAQKTLADLPFRDQMYAQAQAAVQSSPWASQTALDRTALTDDWGDDLDSATQAMADSHADAVIFISPGIYLDNTGQNMYVSFHVTTYEKIAGMSSDKPITHRYASQEFRYRYPLTLHDPEPSFTQQKQDAQLMASMSVPGALPYWIADDGAQLRKDLADALPKIGADLAKYLGGPATP